MAESGGLQSVMDRTYPLGETVAAHAATEARKPIGKVVLRPWRLGSAMT
ncbi:MAG: zinc-binding dehydrogenase [Chloroflexota bacterium]|nr:zinc-binding dehydrogenase [Chloroflexota bacterium]MDE2920511.1 zinc-binding dehydrogenase [Chloroflexota bacterium]